MRRYFVAILSIGLLGLACLVGVFVASAHVPVETNHWEVDGFRRKLALAEHPGPRILIVAGSNAYFGIRAEDFARRTGRHATNLGLQGAVPFAFYSALLQPRLRAGDVVILPLEYGYYGAIHPMVQERIATIEASVALSLMPSYLYSRPPAEFVLMARHVPVAQLRNAILDRLGFVSREPFRRGDFNRWGDNVRDYRSPVTHLHLRNAVLEEQKRGLTAFDEASPSARSITRFAQWAKAQNVLVVAAFPNAMKVEPFDGPKLDEMRQAIVSYWSRLGVRVLTQGAVIQDEHVLDTPFHPTLQGAILRTNALVAEYCTARDACLPARN